MTTDNKTLADVQPGGRVRLGDQPPFVFARFVNGVRMAEGVTIEKERNLTDAMQVAAKVASKGPNGEIPVLVHVAALSAQPSPGGQGDALVTDSMVEAAHAAYWAHPDDSGEDRPCMRAALEAALAARQPVSETDAYQQGFRDGQDRTCTVVARQPVGEPVTVEAVATVRRWSNGDRYIDWLTEGGIADLEAGDVLMVSDRRITDESGSGEVYAAPPAQAVDLGQFRPAVELMEWQERGHANPDFPRGDAKKHAEALRLLDLIDSQAVGK